MENGPKQAAKLVTKAEYARIRGWNRSYLSLKETKARIAPAMVPDGKGGELVDVAKANEIFKIETDTAKVRKPSAPAPSCDSAPGEDPDQDPESMDARRRENLRLKNEELELKLAEQKGLTLPRAGVLSAAAQAGQTIRENFFALVPGLAERFATMNDAREIRTVLDGALRGCLDSVSNDFMRRIQPAGAGEGQPVAH
jgi:hypothetical protein